MPQMSPLFWFNMYLYMILMIFISMILIYYIYNPKLLKKNIMKNNFNLKW